MALTKLCLRQFDKVMLLRSEDKDNLRQGLITN